MATITTTPPPRTTTLQEPTRVRFGVLGFACSLSLITYLDRICIMRAKENMQGDLGFTDNQIGLVFSAFILGYLLFEVPGGWMGDVWGSRRVITRIVLCWSLFTALTGCVYRFAIDTGYHLSLGSLYLPLVLDSLVVLLLVRFLFGAGEAGAYPNLTRVVGAWFPFRERAFALGAIWMSARLGGAFAPLILGRLSDLVGWRQAFWVLGLVGVTWCIPFYLWFRDRPEQKRGCNEAERDLIRSDAGGGRHTESRHARPPSSADGITTVPGAVAPSGVQETPRVPPFSTNDVAGAGLKPAPTQSVASPWRQMATAVTLWAMCLASFSVCFGWYFFPTWQPDYLKKVFGTSYADSELLTGLPFLLGAFGCLAGGRLSDYLVRWTGSRRWGRSLIGVLGFAAAGACMLAAAFAGRQWLAVALFSTAFLLNDLAIPIIWAVCADVGGRFAGTVSGIMNLAGGVGAIISPALIPQVLTRLRLSFTEVESWRIVLIGLAVSWFVGAAAWLFIDAGKPLFKDH
jgi:MFS transporter, ACS family, glucarate transporter